MFNLKSFAFQFEDVSIYCVGSQEDVNLLHLFFKLHEDKLNAYAFIKRIIFNKIYAYVEGNGLMNYLRCQIFNLVLKRHGFLMNMKYFEEAIFLSYPIKFIEVLMAPELYGNEVEVSKYWRKRFPLLPEIFVIPKP